MGALGCTQRTRGSRRVGSALEWLGGATCTVEETCARDSAQAAGVCSQHAWCGKKVIARASAQGQVRRRSTFVWRRERSGHDRVCAGYAGR